MADACMKAYLKAALEAQSATKQAIRGWKKNLDKKAPQNCPAEARLHFKMPWKRKFLADHLPVLAHILHRLAVFKTHTGINNQFYRFRHCSLSPNLTAKTQFSAFLSRAQDAVARLSHAPIPSGFRSRVARVRS